MEVSIIIVNYRTPEMTCECIASILENIHSISSEIIVVDNASGDDSVRRIRDPFSGVQVIESAENLGYGRAMNLGVRHAEGDFLLILNSDIIIQEDFLAELIEKHKQLNAGISGTKLVLPDGSSQKTFSFFPPPMLVVANEIPLCKKIPSKYCRRYANYRTDYQREIVVDWVTGALMLIRKVDFDRVGGFDDGIFMYYEDVDLCKMVRDVTGKHNHWFPQYKALHKHCATRDSLPVGEYDIFKVAEKESALHYIKKHHFHRHSLIRMLLRLVFSWKSLQFYTKMIHGSSGKRAKYRTRYNTVRKILEKI